MSRTFDNLKNLLCLSAVGAAVAPMVSCGEKKEEAKPMNKIGRAHV